MPELSAHSPADEPAIEQLHDLSVGPARHRRPSYRLREGVAPAAGLAFAVRDRAAPVATLRFWPVTISSAVPALLLGPLAVHPGHRGRGLATALVEHGLAAARRQGHCIVAAVGDPAFFARFGFVQGATAGLAMPALADDSRLVVLALKHGALSGSTGTLRPLHAPVPA